MKQADLIEVLQREGFERPPWPSLEDALWLHRPRRSRDQARTVLILDATKPDPEQVFDVTDRAFQFVDIEVLGNRDEVVEAPAIQPAAPGRMLAQLRRGLYQVLKPPKKHWFAALWYCDALPENPRRVLLGTLRGRPGRIRMAGFVERGAARLVLARTRHAAVRRAMEDFCGMIGVRYEDVCI